MQKFALTAAGLAAVALTCPTMADLDVPIDLTGPGGNQVDQNFDTSGDLGDATINVDFVNQGGLTWAGDLLIGVVDPNGAGVEYGGYDMSFGYSSAGDFPSSWDSSTSNTYTHSFSLAGFGIGGSGTWTVSLSDGYSAGSSTDHWTGTLTLVGLGGPSDPCATELRDAPCNADVDNDNVVGVEDLLAVIGTFGEVGDGSARPLGDCAPLPTGDCTVNVEDVLAVIGGFGANCTPVDPTGGCCMSNGDCSTYTEAACNSMGGSYLGDDSDCSTCINGACCYGDGTCAEVNDTDCAGTFVGGSCADAGCEPVAGACCVDGATCIDDLDQASCDAFGGTMIEGMTCAQEPCGVNNNDCGSATDVATGTHAFDTTDATDSGFGEPDDSQCAGTYLDWAASPDAWFKTTADSDGLMSVSLCDAASYDTSLVLYEGADCNSLVQVACNGDSTVETGCQAYYSGIYDHPITNGNTYYIRIGGWQGATGPGNMMLDIVGGDTQGACCVAGSCVGENTFGECDALGGLWFNGGTCADTECPQPYIDVACDETEAALGCVCFVDGDDVETDCNGGANIGVPTYTDLTIGSSICGTSSVWLDGPTGGQYRDLDWWHNAALNGGGMYQFSIGSDHAMVCLVLNEATGVVDYVVQNLPGFMEAADIDLPAGSWAVVSGSSDWNVGVFCGSGLETYTLAVE